MGNENLAKLRALTDDLPPIPRLDELVENGTQAGRFIEYPAQQGTVIGFNLYHDKHIAIQRVFFSNGSITGDHTHGESVEMITITEGELVVEFVDTGKRKTLKAGDGIKIDKGVGHQGLAIKDTWAIAVTIPADEGFPK